MRYGFLVILMALSFLPFSAEAQLVACMNGPECGTCEFVATIKNVWQFLMLLAGIIATIVIVYVGLKLVTSGGDVSAKSKAKELLTNVVIGLVLLLASFAIVDTVMKAFVPASSSLFNWDDMSCIRSITPEDRPIDLGVGSYFEDLGVDDEGNYIGSYGVGDCSPQSFREAGLPQHVANAFSCFTQNESGCILDAQNPWTSARGPLQIVRGLDDDCHNLNNAACTLAAQRAGYNISGELNCSHAFIGGTSEDNPSRARSGMQNLYNACNAAIANIDCTAQAGLCLYNDGGFGHWTNQDDNGRNAQCIG